MNPQLQSMLTSVGMIAATSISAWAVSKGFIAGSDQASFANDLVGVVGGMVVIALGAIKAKQVSQTSMIKAVNAADNGVSVVPTTAAAAAAIPAVSAPLK